MEDPFHHALAAGVLDDAGELRHDVIESGCRDLDGQGQLRELELVLHQAQLRHEPREIVVYADHTVVVGSNEIVDVCGRETEVGGHTVECGAGTDPELADRGIRVELRSGPVGALPEVEHGLVAVLAGLEDENRVGLGIRFPAGQVGEGRMGAERGSRCRCCAA